MLRLFLIVVSATGVLWSISLLPDLWLERGAREIGLRLVSGDVFRRGDLQEMLSRTRSHVGASPAHAEVERVNAIMLLRLAELEMNDGSSEAAEQKFRTAENAVRASLALNPEDSFAWLLLYLVHNITSGYGSENLRLLQESYEAGPREGWVAVSRNRRALAVLSLFDEPTGRAIVAEFAGLVDAGFAEEAQASLTGTGWVYRERLLASLEQVELPAREAFAKVLATRGIVAHVPGITMSDRPWQLH